MQAEYNKNLVKNLPDAFRKTPDSNNFKILEIERITLEEIRARLRDVDSVLDINNAKGKTLDFYGERVGQVRGIADDEKYILLIKAKIMRNLSNGTYSSIVNALCQTFDCDPSMISIKDGEEAKTIVIDELPLEVINKAGLTSTQALAIIKSMLPVGVSLSAFFFDGSFELASSYEDMETDGDAEGLTDTYENMNNPEAIGGYLGMALGDEKEQILPIYGGI